MKRPLVTTAAVALAAGLLMSCDESKTTPEPAAKEAVGTPPVAESAEEELERADKQREAFNRDAHAPHESHSATVPAR